jgi:hypothetical protein
MKCFIYRNLNRKGHVYSFKALEGPYKGRVVAYGEAFVADDVEFHVSFAGWQRAVREKRRNVHAGIIGDVTAISSAKMRLPNSLKVDTVYPNKRGARIRYHPYETHGSFVKNDRGYEVSVQRADRVNVFRSMILATNAQ